MATGFQIAEAHVRVRPETTRQDINDFTRDLERSFRRKDSDFERMGKRMGENISDGLKREANGSGISDGIIDDVEGDSGSFIAVGKKMGGWIIAGLGAVGIGKLFLDEFMGGVEREMSQDRAMAALGLSESQAATLGDAAGAAWANAWGESTEANIALGSRLIRAGLIDPTASEADMQAAIEQAQTIADVWEVDVFESVFAVQQLVSKGLADSAEEGFDAFSTLLQSSSGDIDELLAATTEYSAFLAELGVPLESFFGGLAVAETTQEIDKVGDALKEMRILMAEMNDTTQESLFALGIYPDEAQAAYEAGGVHAEQMTQRIFSALGSIEDRTHRHNTAIGIMGVPYEDLGDIADEVLDGIVNGLDIVEGKTAEVADAAYDNIGTGIEGAVNRAKLAIDDWVDNSIAPAAHRILDAFETEESLFEGLLAGTEEFGQILEENEEQITAWFQELTNMIGRMWEEMFPVVRPVIQQVAEAMAEIFVEALIHGIRVMVPIALKETLGGGIMRDMMGSVLGGAWSGIKDFFGFGGGGGADSKQMMKGAFEKPTSSTPTPSSSSSSSLSSSLPSFEPISPIDITQESIEGIGESVAERQTLSEELSDLIGSHDSLLTKEFADEFKIFADGVSKSFAGGPSAIDINAPSMGTPASTAGGRGTALSSLTSGSKPGMGDSEFKFDPKMPMGPGFAGLSDAVREIKDPILHLAAQSILAAEQIGHLRPMVTNTAATAQNTAAIAKTTAKTAGVMNSAAGVSRGSGFPSSSAAFGSLRSAYGL